MLGINLEKNTYCAIKMMKKNEVNSVHKLQKFLNEVKLLSEAKHKNIIELLYVNIDAEYSDQWATSKVVYYAMKFAENGELFNFVDNTPKFSEELARFYFR